MNLNISINIVKCYVKRNTLQCEVSKIEVNTLQCEVMYKIKKVNCKITLDYKKQITCKVYKSVYLQPKINFKPINYFNYRKEYSKDLRLTLNESNTFIGRMNEKEIESVKKITPHFVDIYSFRKYFWFDKSEKRDRLINVIVNSEKLWREQSRILHFIKINRLNRG